MGNLHMVPPTDTSVIELYVRGEIPEALAGSLLVATNRRHKDRSVFSRWHDSQTDLMRLDLRPGRPGCVTARILAVDPNGADLGAGFQRSDFDRQAINRLPAYGYATQPNHGINVAGETVWATNLLFGAPLEVDLRSWRPRRLLRYVTPELPAPRVSSTAHFARSLDGRRVYFHQSLLEAETVDHPVRAAELRLVELDTNTGAERVWDLHCPNDDDNMAAANFHSAFYFEEDGKRFVGLLRTGAVVEYIAPHLYPHDHIVERMPSSTIWIVQLDDTKNILKAELLPGIRELDGLALSHLDVDASGGNGFVLYANYKEADVAEETHGENLYSCSGSQT